MKKKILMFLCAICFIVPAMFCLTACYGDNSEGSEDDDFVSYITVSGIETEYMINEELNLSNAILKYHESEDDIYTKKIT